MTLRSDQKVPTGNRGGNEDYTEMALWLSVYPSEQHSLTRSHGHREGDDTRLLGSLQFLI